MANYFRKIIILINILIVKILIVKSDCLPPCIFFPIKTPELGSKCETSFEHSGYCTRLVDCPLNRFVQHRQDICFFEGKEPVVCCVPETVITSSPIFKPSPSSEPLIATTPPTIDQRNDIFDRVRKSDRLADKKCLELPFSERLQEPSVAQNTNNTVQTNVRADNGFTGVPTTKAPYFAFVGGVSSVMGDNPQMAAIGWKSLGDKIDWRCGGSLISENFIITAAHCVNDPNDRPDIITVGSVNLIKELSPTIQNFTVIDVVVHPSYASGIFYHDIALVKISPKAFFNHYVKPACLWTQPDVPVSELIAMGYGTDSFAGRRRNVLYEGNLTLIENDNCQQLIKENTAIPNGLLDNQICAKDPKGETDTCQGDSGGPLLFRTGDGFYYTNHHLVGITSFGESCAGTSPGVYTRVSSYIDWIESIVWPEV